MLKLRRKQIITHQLWLAETFAGTEAYKRQCDRLTIIGPDTLLTMTGALLTAHHLHARE